MMIHRFVLSRWAVSLAVPVLAHFVQVVISITLSAVLTHDNQCLSWVRIERRESGPNGRSGGPAVPAGHGKRQQVRAVGSRDPLLILGRLDEPASARAVLTSR